MTLLRGPAPGGASSLCRPVRHTAPLIEQQQSPARRPDFCYVADPWAGMVRVYEADRLYWRDELVLGGRAPIALAVGPDGLLYVAGQAGRLDVVRPEQPSGG